MQVKSFFICLIGGKMKCYLWTAQLQAGHTRSVGYELRTAGMDCTFTPHCVQILYRILESDTLVWTFGP